jgi:hypothetical protein
VENVPTITYFRGKSIDDMPRDELLETIRELGRLLNEAYESQRSTHDMYRRLRAVR